MPASSAPFFEIQMANILEYTLSLNDSMSSKLSKIGISSDAALSKFAKLEKQTAENSKLMNTMGTSVGSLKQKLDLLRAEKEWIPAKNINDIRTYNKEINSLERQIDRLNQSTGESKIKTWARDAFSSIPFAGFLTNPLVMLGAAAGNAVRLGVQQDLQNTSFEVLLGSEKASKKMVQDITKYGMETPYDKMGLGESAKTMLSFGIDEGKVMPVLKAIGDVAMGDANKMQSLTLAFSQMSSTGKLMGQDLLQMINAGFNPLAVISKKTGKSIGDLKQEMEGGKISSQMVEDAFLSASAKGGQFENMAQKMGLTLGGKLAQTMDLISEKFLGLYNVIQPVISFGLDAFVVALDITSSTLGWLIDGLSNADPVVIGLTASVAALTVATKWNTIATKAQDFWLNALIIKEKVGAVVTKAKAVALGIATGATWAWETATMALNAAWAASPIGMVILGVTALGAAVYGVSKLFDQSTAAEKVNNQVKSRALEKTIEQRSELEILFANLKNAKAGTDAYKKSLQELESAYPGIIEKYNLQKGSLADINAAHKELVANIDAVAQQEARKEILKENYQSILKSQMERKTGDYSTFEQIQRFTGGGNIVTMNRLSEEYSLKNQNKILQDQIAKNEIKKTQNQTKNSTITGDEKKVTNQIAQAFGESTEAEIKERIKSLQDKKEGLAIGSKEYKSTSSEIDRLQQKLNPESSKNRGSSRSSESIATGGTKNTTININMDNIVGVLTVTGKDFKEAKDKLQSEVTDAVVRALNMGTSTAG